MQIHGLILSYRPRRDRRLNWPGWLTLKVVTCQL